MNGYDQMKVWTYLPQGITHPNVENDVEWDWCDDRFLRKDVRVNEPCIWMFYEGIGRMVDETQMLSDLLILMQVGESGLFKDGREVFTLENLDSTRLAQMLKKSTLGRLFREVCRGDNVQYNKDLNAMKVILDDRNYFIHTFFSRITRSDYDEDQFYRDVARLKKLILTVIKFRNRYSEYYNLIEE